MGSTSNNPTTHADPSGFACYRVKVREGESWIENGGRSDGDLPTQVQIPTQYVEFCFNEPRIDIPPPNIDASAFENTGSGTAGNGGRRQKGDEKCWNGEPGGVVDGLDGFLRELGNLLWKLGIFGLPGVQVDKSALMDIDPFGYNNTNAGIFGRQMAPAATLFVGTPAVGISRYAGMQGGTQGARSFLGLVGNRGVHMDHFFAPAAVGGSNAYWNLYPVRADLNMLMGRANNFTLPTAQNLLGLMARYRVSAVPASGAAAAAVASEEVGKAIQEAYECD